MLEILFWFSFFIIFYTFIGYGVILFVLVKLLRSRNDEPFQIDNHDLPSVSIVIAAYNEEDFIMEKVSNLKNINYPPDKLQLVFVTDGSTDRTYDILSGIKNIYLYHKPERNGKTAAINRIMPKINSDITVFNDANTLINKEAVYNLVRHFIRDEKVGSVAGEKRILTGTSDNASSSGEGFYWKYESFLKKMDSKLHTAMGAAGELFAIRTELYNYPSKDIIIEDFVVTLNILKKGFIIKYEPDAYAMERSSANIREELKRKIRIAAGGIQAIILFREFLNIFKYGLISFQFISHRVLRWSLTPILLPVLLILNLFILWELPATFYVITLIAQLIFYLSAFIGYIMQFRKIKFKIFFIPFYFLMMNYAVYAGFFRYIRGKQSSVWERAARAK